MEQNPVQSNTPVAPVNQVPLQPEPPVQAPTPQPLATTPSGITPPSPTVTHKSSKLKWFIVIILLVALVLFVFLGGYFLLSKGGVTQESPTITRMPTPTLASTPEMVGQFIWAVKKTNLTPTEMEIKNAFASYGATSSSELNENGKSAVTGIYVSSTSAGFAFAYIGLEDKNNNLLPTSPDLYLVNKTGNVWKITPPNNTSFCSIVKTYPVDLLTQNVKDYLVNCFPK